MKKTIAYSLSWKETEKALQKELNNNRVQLERVDFECYEAYNGEITIEETAINNHIAEFLNTGVLVGYAHENGIIFIEE